MSAMVDLPEPERPVNQTIAAFWCLMRARAALSTDRDVAVHVGGTSQPEVDHPRGGRLIGGAIDQDEGTGAAIVAIRIEGDGNTGREVADADLVQDERSRGELLLRVDVDLVLDGGDGRRHELRADAHHVGAARQHLRPRTSR